MLNQKPEIGDTLVLRNGERFTCISIQDLKAAGISPYEELGVTKIYGSKPSSGKYPHWQGYFENGMALSSEITGWDIIEVIPAKKELKIEIGDIIVTKDRGEYVCADIRPDGEIHGTRPGGYFNNWDKYGISPSKYPEIQEAYQIVEIKKPVKNPVQKPENNLEFQLRVLQKENEILTSLLLKEGKL